MCSMSIPDPTALRCLLPGGATDMVLHRIATRTRSAFFRGVGQGRVYGLKVYPCEAQPADLIAEAAFGDALSEGGVRAPKYLRDPQGTPYVRQADGTFLVAYRWLFGTTDPPQLPRYFRGIGLVLAAAHRCAPRWRGGNTGDWLWIDSHETLSATPESPFRNWAEDIVSIGRPWSLDEGTIVVHNDVTPQNTLWRARDPRPALLDLTNCIPAPREWDLASAWAGAVLWHPERVPGGHAEVEWQRIVLAYESAQTSIDRQLFVALARLAVAQRGLFAFRLGDRSATFLYQLAEEVEAARLSICRLRGWD